MNSYSCDSWKERKDLPVAVMGWIATVVTAGKDLPVAVMGWTAAVVTAGK